MMLYQTLEDGSRTVNAQDHSQSHKDFTRGMRLINVMNLYFIPC